MGEYIIHNVRFYHFEPKAIQCMVYEDETNRLALARADGNVEVWNCQHRPFLQQVFPGDQESVEALVWCQGRLFSAGLHGYILEYDLSCCGVKSRTAVTGGPVWCLAVSADKLKLAAGTEEGYVCIFDILDESIIYSKTLDKQKGRILSIGWHSSGDYIVTGSINFVQLWSLREGRVTRCSFGQEQEIIVWCVGILDNMTLVSGDSRGMTCFWNSVLGTITDSLQTHKADVLSLAIAHDQHSLYVAGVDPTIVEVKHVDASENSANKGRRSYWMRAMQRRNIHSHDVRALAITGTHRLYSGGVDTVLALTYYPPKTVCRYPALPSPGSVAVARAAGCVLLRYQDRVELWHLGASSSIVTDTRFLPVTQDRVKLLELQSQNNEAIDWCSVSPKAEWIAYIVKGKLRIFQFYPPMPGSLPSVRRVRGICPEIEPCWQVLWLGEVHLASATTSGSIQIISVSEKIEATLDRTLHLPPGHRLLQLHTNTQGNLLAAVDDKHSVTVFDLEHSTSTLLPHYSAPITAVGLPPPGQQEVVVVHADMAVKEYSLSSRSYTPFCRRCLLMPLSDLLKTKTVIRSVAFDPQSSSRLFFHDDSAIIVLDKDKICQEVSGREEERPRNPAKMKRRADPVVESTTNSNSSSGVAGSLSFARRSNQIIHLSCVKEKDFVSIELNPLKLLDQLPPTLKVKKYGGS